MIDDKELQASLAYVRGILLKHYRNRNAMGGTRKPVTFGMAFRELCRYCHDTQSFDGPFSRTAFLDWFCDCDQRRIERLLSS